MDDSSVRVALRIRPTISREIIEGCQICTTVTPGTPQVWIGGNQAYTYDYVFDRDSTQEAVFANVQSLVEGCLHGYNATILAYGQTGSGKTYTMGTGFQAENLHSPEINSTHGIIPRAVHYIFNRIQEIRKTAIGANECPPEFKVMAQFVEIHNEDINDLISSDLKLLDFQNSSLRPRSPVNTPPPWLYRSGGNGMKSGIRIHEDADGNIYMLGVQKTEVTSAEETLTCLRDGALVRSTASTNMNDSSSRSHAIFTLHITQQKILKEEDGGDGNEDGSDFVKLSAKFHFVDLAGSERLKRTGATGDRAKEGISINCGLLALGNVISALGDKSKKASHIPYRDSKLTRLLSDSLGGNSQTLMIACISPSDRDFVETLNTMKYANRARNIKNKITVNQDKSSKIISSLRQEILQLQSELQDYRQGKFVISPNGQEVPSDLYHENCMMQGELESLRNRVKALQDTLEKVNTSNANLIAEKAIAGWTAQNEGSPEANDLATLVRKYTLDIEELRSKLLESESACEQLKRKQKMTTASMLNNSLSPRVSMNTMTSRPGTADQDTAHFVRHTDSVLALLNTAKIEVTKEKKLAKKLVKLKKRAKKGDEDDASEDEEESGSSYSSISEEDETESTDEGTTPEEIASINDQINTKQRLIEQLELSSRRVLETREQYEQQIQILSTRIKHTEEERDSILASYKTTPAPPAANIKKVRDEYELKVNNLQKQLSEMKNMLREHNNLVRKTAATEKQVAALKVEVDNMKRTKVKLQIQLKEENAKAREIEARRMKEIHQLKKDQRKKDTQIRALESKDRLKEAILKRKHEEVNALKKQNKNGLSRRAAGRLHHPVTATKKSPIKGKKKWSELIGVFSKHSTDRKCLDQLEKELMCLMTTRKRHIHDLEDLTLQKEEDGLSAAEINSINDNIDNVNSAMRFIEERLEEIQRRICELTASSPKMDGQFPDISLAVEHFAPEDCEYLMKKMYEYTMDNLEDAKEKGTKLAVADQKIQEMQREVLTLNEILSHVYGKYCANDPNLSPELSQKIQQARLLSLNSNGPIPITSTPISVYRGGNIPLSPIPFKHRFLDMEGTSQKARRKTSTTQELLLGMQKADYKVDDATFVRPNPVDPLPIPPPNVGKSVSARSFKLDRRNTFLIPEGGLLNDDVAMSKSSTQIPRRTNIFTTTKSLRPSNNNTQAPTDDFDFDTTFLSEPIGIESAPGSPNTTRRENVWQRLTSTSGVNTAGGSIKGTIKNIRERNGHKLPFVQTHVADGHSKSVTGLYATDDRLFSGSKDTTVKIWDLISGKEAATYTGSTAAISSIKFCEESQMLFVAAGCYVRVFDTRINRDSSIKTLTSRGICHPQDFQFSYPTPFQLPAGEKMINCVAVSHAANSLFTTYEKGVRLWDLRTFTTYGEIPGKHVSSIICMEAQSYAGKTTLVTGSKDHTIKVFSYATTEPMMNVCQPPKATLDPVHYDGIESLALSGNTLFSGSRDTHIKKWNLEGDTEHLLHYKEAHKNWISGLCLPPSNPGTLVSCSRDGFMKLWPTDNTTPIASVEAHKGGVSCMTSNSTSIFTASTEYGNIGFWKLRNLRDSGGDTSPTTDA